MGSWLSYPDSHIVQTANGKVVGRRLVYKGPKQVDAFQGIPFARPPIGPLRFKRPVPPDNWSHIRPCKGFGPRNIQQNFFFFDNFRRGYGSEDCLYLNVFTPCWNPPEGGFPVMVYVHGGAFVMDGAMTYGDKTICENIVTRGIVVVTVQYRLGYLGFFTTGDDACPGNNGLWDLTEALQWVQRNVHAFGGNKDNVTVVGQSAGGALADLLHLSPHSTGLFHKVVLMSGNAMGQWANSTDMVEQSKRKARELGIEHWSTSYELIEKLQSVSADLFAAGMMENPEDVALEVTPSVDGVFFPDEWDNLRERIPPKPTMAGVTKLEGLLFMIGASGDMNMLERLVRGAIPPEIIDKDKTVFNSLIKRYLKTYPDSNSKELYRATAEVMSDRFFNVCTLQVCRSIAKTFPDNPVYLYVFDYFNPRSWGILRWTMPMMECSHCTELAYILGKGIIYPFSFDNNDRKMMDIFTSVITNFVKNGDPNSSMGTTDLTVHWDPLTNQRNSSHYVFRLQPTMSDDYFEGRPSTVLSFES